MEESFNVSTAMLSKTIGGYLLAFGISTLFWGPITDKFGRKPVINLSMFTYMLASIGCALSEDFETFVLMRSLQGISVSGALISSRAMIRESHNVISAQRAMSQITLMFSIGPIIAPLIGAFLADMFGWRSIFWFLAALGGFLILLMSLTEETLHKSARQSIHPKKVAKNYLDASKNKEFMIQILCLSLSFAGFFLYIVGSPIVIYSFLGLDGSYFSYLFSALLLGVVSGFYISAKRTRHLSLSEMVGLGVIIMLLGSVINIALNSYFEPTLITVAAPLIIYSTGLVVMTPVINILIIDCFEDNRGFATSVKTFFQMSFSAVVTIFMLPLLSGDIMHFAYAQALFILLAWLSWKSKNSKNKLRRETLMASKNKGLKT